MNGDRDGFSPPSAQELGPMSGTIYNSQRNDTLRTLFCQEAPWPSSSSDQDVLLLAMPLLLYRFDTIASSAPSSGPFLSFATSFPSLQISDKGMKASVLFGLPETRLLG